MWDGEVIGDNWSSANLQRYIDMAGQKKDKIVKIVHARASEKLRGDIRGMTRDPDKIKNYERALLDNAPRNFQWCIR